MEPEQELEHELQILKNAGSAERASRRQHGATERGARRGNRHQRGCLDGTFAGTGFSKLVVFKGDMDHIVGYVHAKDLFDLPGSLKEIRLPTFVVPAAMAGDELLRQFLKRRRHLAVVVDEFGGTAGILTMEDIVEELLGEIDDEHDLVEDDVEHALGDGVWRVPARREVRALNETHGGIARGKPLRHLGWLSPPRRRHPESGSVVRWKGLNLWS